MSTPPLSGRECPTGCGRIVGRGKLLCITCWREVPEHLQSEVHRTWRAYRAAARHVEDFDRRRVARAAYEEARDAAIGAVA